MTSKLTAAFPILRKVGPAFLHLHQGVKQAGRSIGEIADHARNHLVVEPRIRGLNASREPLPVVHVYVVCRNESRMIPYFMDHYLRFADNVVVYDNESTDNSLELLSAYPQVNVHSFSTRGQMNDGVLRDIRNTAWKDSIGKADFVVVCDMDELLHHPNLPGLLRYMKRRRYTVLRPLGVQMVSESLPEFDGTTPLVERIPDGFPDRRNYSKTVLFDPNVVDIRFSVGSHSSDPAGEIRILSTDHAKLLHYKWVDRAFLREKQQLYSATMSEENRKRGWSNHKHMSQDRFDTYYDSILAKKRRIIKRQSAGTPHR